MKICKHEWIKVKWEWKHKFWLIGFVTNEQKGEYYHCNKCKKEFGLYPHYRFVWSK